MVRSIGWLAAAAAGCTADPAAPESEATEPAWEFGQPIRTIREVAGPDPGLHVYMGSAFLADGDVVTVGAWGLNVVDGATGSLVSSIPDVRGAAVAYDVSTRQAWVATSPVAGVTRIDLSDPTTPAVVAEHVLASTNQKISADSGLVLVGTVGAAELYDDQGFVGSLPVASSRGVALLGTRALVADGASLVLFDVADPAAPVELSRTALAGTGYDVAFDGEYAAIALGSGGLDVVRVASDTLVPGGHIDLASSAYSVALDGTFVWAAAWSVVGLVELAETGPVLLGYEPTEHFAMAVSARDGFAFASELDFFRQLERVVGVAGPEIEVPPTVWFHEGSAEKLPISVRNCGALPLEVELVSGRGWTFSEPVLAIAPGDEVIVDLIPGDDAGPAELGWTSNDPDEPVGTLTMAATSEVVGEPQPPFRSDASFTWPSRELVPMSSADFLGTVTLLVYFRSDCPICAVTVPDLHDTLGALYAQAPDLQMVLVNEDDLGIDPAWRFVDQLAIDRQVIVDRNSAIYHSYAAAADDQSALIVPLHVLLDRQGIVRWYGREADIEAIVAAVSEALADEE